MRRHYWFWGTVLALSSMLMAGCSSVPASRHASQKPGAAGAPGPRPAAGEDLADKAARAHAHYGAGVIHEMNDELEPALKEYYQAALDDPDNEWLVLEVSRRFIQARHLDKALEVLSCAAARPKASGAIYARLGLVYSELGKYDQATVACRTAIKLSPESLAGYQNLFLNYLQSKHKPEALKVLDEAARQSKADADFLLGLAEMYQNLSLQAPEQKKPLQAKALAVLNRAEQCNSTNVLLRLRLADGFNLAEASTKATVIYLDLLREIPDVPLLRERIHAKLASIYLRSSDSKRASEQLEAVVRDDPTNPQAYFYLGRLAYEDKKPAEAADYLRKTVLLSPDFDQAYYYLALAQLSLDKTSDALATLDKARQKFPQNFVLEFCTGLAYSREKAYAQAIPHYTAAEVIAQATDTNRLDQDLYFQLGAAYERTGNINQAEKYFEKCLQRAPDFPEALNYLGYMWAEHGLKLEKAHELIAKAVKAEPKNAAYLDSLGWVLFKLNQPKQALKYLLKAVELSQEPDADVYNHLGDVYAALQQPDKAREAWAKSLSLQPNEQVKKKLEASPSRNAQEGVKSKP